MDLDLIWIIGGLILPPILIVLHIRRGRERTGQMEQAAARAGLSFRKKDNSLPFLRTLNAMEFSYPRVRNVAKGEVAGCEVVLPDHHYRKGFGENRTEYSLADLARHEVGRQTGPPYGGSRRMAQLQ